MTDEVPLGRILTELARAGVPAMLTGSFASSFHGEPRATRGVDIVIDADESRLSAFVQSLPDDQFYVDEAAAREALETRSMFNVIDRMGFWKIDLIIRKNRPFSVAEFDRRRRQRVGDVDVDVATAEDVVVAKLDWARATDSERQLEDVAAILRIRGEALDRSYIDHWVEELGLGTGWLRAQALAGRR